MSTDAPARPSGSGGGGRPELGGRRRFHYDASETVLVTDGYMSLRDAQAVLQECFDEWGLRATTDAEINPLLGMIAHALRQGTSAERDFTKVYFVVRGVTCNLDVLKLAASRYDNSENPVRVWARSYNNGEMAVRTYDMLRDPKNTILREEAALDYGCSHDVVHVSFDYADAMVKFEDMKLSQIERLVIKANTANKVRTSRSVFIGSSEGGSVQDSATHMAEIAAAPPLTTQPGINPGGGRNRANFSTMR